MLSTQETLNVKLSTQETYSANAFNQPTVNEAFNDAFNRLEQKIKESNSKVNKCVWNKRQRATPFSERIKM
jgi:hypothetical protein